MVTAEPGGDAQTDAMSAMLLPMLFLIGMMVLLMFFPGFRDALSDGAGVVIEPILPFHNQYFIPTVFFLGSSIMVVNTIIRSFFFGLLKRAANKGKPAGFLDYIKNISVKLLDQDFQGSQGVSRL